MLDDPAARIASEAAVRVASGEQPRTVARYASDAAAALERDGMHNAAHAVLALARALELADRDAGAAALASAVQTGMHAALGPEPHNVTALLLLTWVFRALSGWRAADDEEDGDGREVS